MIAMEWDASFGPIVGRPTLASHLTGSAGTNSYLSSVSLLGIGSMYFGKEEKSFYLLEFILAAWRYRPVMSHDRGS